MKSFLKTGLFIASLAAACISGAAQDDESGVVRRRTANDRNATTTQDGTVVTDRMRNFYSNDDSSITDADRKWMRVIYRTIDLEKDENAALYFPEEPIEGQENLFRIILRLLANNTIAAYEYLDGREVYTDEYKVKVRDVLDRFYIPYTNAKGSTEKNPKFNIDENDVPTNEVLSYFVVEKWEYDTRNNRLRPEVEAICPVLHRAGDFGGEPLKYPMFWVKFNDLRPYLAAQMIFVDDDNNLPSCTYDDFFMLNMYKGDIYKTRNLKNRSMSQLYPDPDDLKRAQDSIQASLDSFEVKLWVPSREEIIAERQRREALQNGESPDSTSVATTTTKTTRSKASSRSKKQSTKKSKVSKPKSSSSSSSAQRSVRRQRK